LVQLAPSVRALQSPCAAMMPLLSAPPPSSTLSTGLAPLASTQGFE
jgi:hypothetical protein